MKISAQRAHGQRSSRCAMVEPPPTFASPWTVWSWRPRSPTWRCIST